MALMIIQLLIVLLALYVGSRYGSLALGAISGIGLAILVLGFGMQPGKPPTDVIYIIIAAGSDLRRHHAGIGRHGLAHPDCGAAPAQAPEPHHDPRTALHVLPHGARGYRPCGVHPDADYLRHFSQEGNPPGTPVRRSFGRFAGRHYMFAHRRGRRLVRHHLEQGICGLMAAALISYRRGLDLNKDPAFQARLKDPQMKEYMYGNTASVLDKEVSKEAKRAVYIFIGALAVIVLFSILQIMGHDIRPKFPTGKVIDGVAEIKPLAMNIIIQIVMISAAAFMIIFCKANPKKAVSGAVWQSGMVAVVAIYGIAWLADTYFANYMDVMQGGLKDIVQHYPWAIAFAFFAVSVLINSQGAVVVAMVPLAYSLGIEGPVLLGVLPSVYGYFFIPNYPSDIATVNFDRSGTTVIGKYLLNHSFMLPGLTSVIVSTIVGTLLVKIFY